jgi:peptide-methionine (R)-S-oxide reductase
MKRRSFISQVVGLAAAAGFIAKDVVAADAAPAPAPSAKTGGTVKIENFTADGKSAGVVDMPRVVKSETEWKASLPAESFEVTRHEGTERAFSGPLDHNKASGLYRCICCDTALYDSSTKFDSGTGWPSFWKPISKYNVAEVTDKSWGMTRTAVSCALCGAHQGHVFDDGPRPTGLRYCMNSVSMRFVART